MSGLRDIVTPFYESIWIEIKTFAVWYSECHEFPSQIFPSKHIYSSDLIDDWDNFLNHISMCVLKRTEINRANMYSKQYKYIPVVTKIC